MFLKYPVEETGWIAILFSFRFSPGSMKNSTAVIAILFFISVLHQHTAESLIIWKNHPSIHPSIHKYIGMYTYTYICVYLHAMDSICEQIHMELVYILRKQKVFDNVFYLGDVFYLRQYINEIFCLLLLKIEHSVYPHRKVKILGLVKFCVCLLI